MLRFEMGKTTPLTASRRLFDKQNPINGTKTSEEDTYIHNCFRQVYSGVNQATLTQAP